MTDTAPALFSTPPYQRPPKPPSLRGVGESERLPDLLPASQGFPDELVALSVRMCWRGVVHFPLIRFFVKEIMMHLGVIGLAMNC